MKISKEKWAKLGARNGYPLTWSGIINSLREGTKVKKLYFNLPKYLFIFYGKPPSIDFEYSKVDFNTNLKELIKKKNKEFDDILIKIEKTIKKDLKILPSSKKNNLLKLYNLYKKECGFMYAGYYLTQTVLEQLKNVLGKKEFEKIKLNIAIPHKITMVGREYHAIEKIKEEYHKGLIDNEKIIKEAEKLTKIFGFIHSEYMSKEWQAGDYISEIKSELRQKQINSKQEIPTYDNEYINWLRRVIRRTTYMFDESKSALVRANWALRKTLTNLGFKEEDIMNCFEKEFLNWLNTSNLPKRDLTKQAKYFALILDGDKYKEVFGKNEVDKIIQEEGITEFESFTEDISKIKGTIAFKGKVIGRVKKTYTQKDANELKEGEILVAGMTTPELIAGMRRAAAFITDEGGLLCHAAIVAREMKKPCIINTKIATKVFKNNDLVEVDANKGIIKKIS